jgi:hypothetical protein
MIIIIIITTIEYKHILNICKTQTVDPSLLSAIRVCIHTLLILPVLGVSRTHIYIYVYGRVHPYTQVCTLASLREFVLRTTVILTPGACGREVPSGSPWTGSGGSAGKSGKSGSPDGFIFEHFICVFTVKMSRVTKRYNVFLTFS